MEGLDDPHQQRFSVPVALSSAFLSSMRSVLRPPSGVSAYWALQIAGWSAFGLAMALSRIGEYPLDYLVVNKGLMALLGFLTSVGHRRERGEFAVEDSGSIHAPGHLRGQQDEGGVQVEASTEVWIPWCRCAPCCCRVRALTGLA